MNQVSASSYLGQEEELDVKLRRGSEEGIPFQIVGMGSERKGGRGNKEQSGEGGEHVEGLLRSPAGLEQKGQ